MLTQKGIKKQSYNRKTDNIKFILSSRNFVKTLYLLSDFFSFKRQISGKIYSPVSGCLYCLLYYLNSAISTAKV